MGAIDFQVMNGPQLVAGTDSRTTRGAWDEAGWTGRLQAAVESAGAGFTGPLQEPYEPWHYEFTPVDPQRARQPAGQHASKGCALADP
jgi:hypothetical protein